MKKSCSILWCLGLLAVAGVARATTLIYPVEAIDDLWNLAADDFKQKYGGINITGLGPSDEGWYVRYRHENLTYMFGPLADTETARKKKWDLETVRDAAIRNRPSLASSKVDYVKFTYSGVYGKGGGNTPYGGSVNDAKNGKGGAGNADTGDGTAGSDKDGNGTGGSGKDGSGKDGDGSGNGDGTGNGDKLAALGDGTGDQAGGDQAGGGNSGTAGGQGSQGGSGSAGGQSGQQGGTQKVASSKSGGAGGQQGGQQGGQSGQSGQQGGSQGASGQSGGQQSGQAGQSGGQSGPGGGGQGGGGNPLQLIGALLKLILGL